MIPRSRVVISLMLSVALFAGGGYVEGGLTVAFGRACMIGGLIMFAVSLYFAGLRLFRGLITNETVYDVIDTYFITAVLLFKNKNIGETSVQEIETPNDLRKVMKAIKKKTGSS